MAGRTSVQRPSADAAPPVPVRPTGGRALDRHTQAAMSARFGHDFSSVRIHTDRRAGEAADALGANAYMLGGDIVFGTGKYQPGSRETDRLLAHELTHVVQLNRFGPGDWGRTSHNGDASEREADGLAAEVMQGHNVDVQAAPGAALARDEANLGVAGVHAGAWQNDEGHGRVGLEGGAGVLDISAEGENWAGNWAGDFQALTGGAEASIGEDGATLGGGLTLASIAGQYQGDHEAARVGVGAGLGMAGRLHWGQSEDGYRSYGIGADIGPVSFDLTTDDPLRAMARYNPISPLLSALVDTRLPGNLTDQAAGMFGLTTKNADLSTTWDAVKRTGGGAPDAARNAGSNVYDAGS